MQGRTEGRVLGRNGGGLVGWVQGGPGGRAVQTRGLGGQGCCSGSRVSPGRPPWYLKGPEKEASRAPLAEIQLYLKDTLACCVLLHGRGACSVKMMFRIAGYAIGISL